MTDVCRPSKLGASNITIHVAVAGSHTCAKNALAHVKPTNHPMTPDRIRFLLAAGIVLTVTSIVAAGPVAGIARTDGQPLETGPFVSHSTPAGPEISHDFQPMYLTSQPNIWT